MYYELLSFNLLPSLKLTIYQISTPLTSHSLSVSLYARTHAIWRWEKRRERVIICECSSETVTATRCPFSAATGAAPASTGWRRATAGTPSAAGVCVSSKASSRICPNGERILSSRIRIRVLYCTVLYLIVYWRAPTLMIVSRGPSILVCIFLGVVTAPSAYE